VVDWDIRVVAFYSGNICSMLVSVALRLLGHNEFSPVSDICSTLVALDEIYGRRGAKHTKDSVALMTLVKKTLEYIPALKKAFKRDPDLAAQIGTARDSTLPHYCIGDYVWCQEIGWGFWPTKIVSVDENVVTSVFYNNDRCYIPIKDAATRIRPFLHDFESMIKMSTTRLEGFEDAMNTALSDLSAGLDLPDAVKEEIRSGSTRDRWSLRVTKIGAVIKVICAVLRAPP
jgi:hypothetical protein